MHLLRLHPVHVGPGTLELLDQLARAVLHAGRKLHGKERANAAKIVASHGEFYAV